MLYDFENSKQRLPKDKQVLTYINMTPKQRTNQDGIVAMAKKSTQGKLDMGNLFRALAYSLDNALSPYLLNGTPEDYKEFLTITNGFSAPNEIEPSFEKIEEVDTQSVDVRSSKVGSVQDVLLGAKKTEQAISIVLAQEKSLAGFLRLI